MLLEIATSINSTDELRTIVLFSLGNLGNSLPNPYTFVFTENIEGTIRNLAEPLFLLLSKYNKNKKTQQPKREDLTTGNVSKTYQELGTPHLDCSLHIYSVPS